MNITDRNSSYACCNIFRKLTNCNKHVYIFIFKIFSNSVMKLFFFFSKFKHVTKNCYFAACIASPVAWFFACFFLIPAYFVVRKRLQKEKDIEKEHDARTANA